MHVLDYKTETRKQWNRTPCGTGNYLEGTEPHSLAWFDAIRHSRYHVSDPWMPRIMPFTQVRGMRLLEIGHGIGSDLLTFAENGAEVCGIDITEEHHRLAKLNFQLHGIPAELKLCDAAEIDYPSNSFDVVYSHGVLLATPDTVRCIGEAYRVLKPGGLFVLSLYRTYSGFHLFAKLLFDGLVRGNLARLGYRGLMATIEQGADGVNIKPLIKTYRRGQLKHMLADFSSVRYKVGHFHRSHLDLLGRFVPGFAEPWLEPWLGWYIVAFATK
jgi:ubiquinone/menaquinone biosynthesis C-methylase UbiE